MEFIEGSRGVYRPIRVLFDTPIYDRALQLCWNINSYKSKIALLRELLMLQEAYQIPSQVTPEDMIHFLMEESKNTLRERLWEFELEDFDEEDAKPLLMLVWAVNMSNKMRDIEFEAQMLLNSSEPLPPKFQHPKLFNVALKYAKILRTNHVAPSSKVLSPQEVVLEVVPRVLQGFWALPRRPLLNMPSQKLSTMSVGVTKAVLDRVTGALTGVEGQTTFSRSIRDDVVLSILTTIRQTHPLHILVNRIKSFAPELLSEIVDVAAEQICEMFHPKSPKVPAPLSPAAEPPATAPVQEDSNLTVTRSPETNPAVVSTPPASPAPPVEPASITNVETREDESDEPSLVNNPESTRDPDSTVVPTSTPPVEPPAIPNIETRKYESDKQSLENNPEPTRDPDSALVPVSPAPPVEPPSIIDVETREDERDKSGLENDTEPTRDPDSAVVPPASTPPAEPPSAFDVETRKDECDEPSLETNPEPTREPDSAAVPVSPAPPVEPPSIIDVETREDERDKSGLGNDTEPTRDPDSAVVPPIMTPPAELPSITDVETRNDENDKSCFATDREATRDPDSAAVVPSLTSPAEPPSVTDVEARVDEKEKPILENDSKPSREPDAAATPVPLVLLIPPADPPSVPDIQAREEETEKPGLQENLKPTKEPDSALTPAPPAPLTLPAEPVIIISMQDSLTSSPAVTEKPTSRPPPAPRTSPTEPPHITDVKDRVDADQRPNIEEGSVVSREPVSDLAASCSPLTSPPLEPVVIVSVLEVKERRVQGFFSWLAQPFCCCFGARDTN
ncbi:cell surface glycoprotein 1-like [Centropristis striata]|uniref:cell surface glycoprotein 1-like n=1 Tax=Centropristis striata TaxID=184440 RepID=UPI0027E12CD9|nr:cell surface glycoprotein 1-like [Centropristis striata]